MTDTYKDQTKQAGTSQKEAKPSMPPEHSDNIVEEQPEHDQVADSFPIVGIGASAGGLAASGAVV